MTENTPTPVERRMKRKLLIGISITVAALLALGAGLFFTLTGQPAPEPEPQATTEPAPVVAPEPTITPTPSPVIETIATPTDCRAIYTPEFLTEWEGVELNDPLLNGVGVSRHDAVETIRVDLPGIDCLWGGPTEGGMSTAVNEVTPEQQTALVQAATDSGFTCDEPAEGIVLCQLSETFTDEESADAAVWTNAEELYFRDGLVVTTWRASTVGTMTDSTQPVYDTLWR